MPNSSSKLVRSLLFGSVYFVQGGILAYFTIFNPVYLRTFDLPFSQIGIAGAVALIPFILKIFIGMLSDKVNLFGLGRRKPFIVLGIALQIIGLLLIPSVDAATAFPLYMLFLFLAALGMSTYDTCSDGLAIEITSESERGFIQSVMVGGRSLGAIIISLLIGIIAESVSWPAVFIMLAIASCLPLLFIATVKEPEAEVEKRELGSAFRSFLAPGLGWFLLLGIVNSLALYSTNTLVGVSLKERLLLSDQQVGYFSGLLYLGAVFGAVIGGKNADKLGRKAALMIAVVISSVGMVLLAANLTQFLAYLIVAAFGMTFGYYETVFLAAGMDFTDKRIAASMFAIIMAVGNIGIGVGQYVTGLLVDAIDFGGTFVILAIINLIALFMIMAIFRKRTNLAVAPTR